MENDMYGVKAAIRKFERRNGTDYIQINEGLIFLYSNGAMRENGPPLPQMREPPDEPVQRAKLIEHYHKTKLERAVKQFDALKRRVLESARDPHWVLDEEQHVRDLRSMQDCILQLKANLAEAEQGVHIASGITPKEAKRRAAEAAQEAQERSEFVTRIKRITV